MRPRRTSRVNQGGEFSAARPEVGTMLGEFFAIHLF